MGVSCVRVPGGPRGFDAAPVMFHARNLLMYDCCVMNESRDVPATELRSNLAAYLDEVRAGATFTITRGTRVAGRLVPPVDEEATDSDD
jgi:Antitoxin Phd_YefM, type II toxin-antitoxin system